MTEERLYSAAEVAEILGIQKQSVLIYYRKFDIGRKMPDVKGRDFETVLFTEADIKEIENTDGRRR